jgi:glucose-6-phosphate isomerase
MIKFDLKFFFDSKNLNLNHDDEYKKNLDSAINISSKLKKDYQSDQNEILKSFSASYQKKIRKLKTDISYTNKKKVVIGLGGSSSGAKAISHYIGDDIVYFDNLDYNYLSNFLKKNSIEDYIFFVISKSGDTFETLAILNLLIYHAKQNNFLDIFKNIIAVTENKSSFLKKFIDQNNIKFIEHNSKIGGRFSVLSETGMLPFLNLGMNIEEYSEKYLDLLDDYENDNSPVKNSAIILTCIKKYKLNLYCNLLYNYKLKHFSYWLHQLHAESLGKNRTGLTPFTSICPKDHHSMMQLYLDGPNDKFFNIFSPQDENYFDKFDSLGFENIEKYTPRELLNKQFSSVVDVFHEKNIPCRVINIFDHTDPANIIELFSYFLIETIILGNLLGLDPYNQPAVQLIKNKI